MKCKTCGGPITHHVGDLSTLVGFIKHPNEDPRCDHDDNCVLRIFRCDKEHNNDVHIRRICPNPDCDWKGKETCFCHEGAKIEDYPNVPFQGGRM